MLPLLDARDLCRAYVAGHGRCWARVQVLAGASLAMHRADRVIVAGPRGSGKTTLLHCLTGLRRPDAGSVRWDAAQGAPYRLCAAPADLAFAPPRGIALVDLPDDSREAGAWIEALHAHAGGWLAFTARHAPLAPAAHRVLRLHDGALRPLFDTRPRWVAEPRGDSGN